MCAGVESGAPRSLPPAEALYISLVTLDNPGSLNYVESKLHLLIRFRIGFVDEELVGFLQREQVNESTATA
jgi:hypothetical protein